MDKIYKVGIIGAGVSGSVTALHLADLGIDNVLFEKKESVVSGPPFCHLHAGGNLYPDISDQQCRTLMKQSIEMARLFPQSIDKRPTFISIPKTEKYEVEKIENRLEMLVSYYKQLIKKDSANAILGAPEHYYKTYTQNELVNLAKKPNVKHPKLPDEWMTNAIKLIDYQQLKMPIILIQEFGWNLFRLAAQAQLALERTDKCSFNLNTEVTGINDVRNKNLDYNWEIITGSKKSKVKYLVNACGFKTGELDQTLKINVGRLIEFKAAYISKWKPIESPIPELIFHGERCTPHGMAQLTPYSDNYYQIHGMTEDITLFVNGLVKADKHNAQPQFNEQINKKLTHGWDKKEVIDRTNNAIQFITKFVPDFETAQVGGPPLFGAQQIPGNDVNLRVGEVSFPCRGYARSEIIKASSALTVANQIAEKIQEENIVSAIPKQSYQNTILDSISKKDIDTLAPELAEERAYPKSLARLFIERE